MADTKIKAADDLVARLRETDGSEADLKAEVEAQAPKAGPEWDPNDPKAKPEYPFVLNWKDGRGKVWTGEFVTKILSIGERQLAGALRARFSSVPLAQLDALTNHLNEMIAHLSFSLTKRPDWAKDLREIQNPDLVQAIYDEVSSHEVTFFGLREAA
jgi:hypothetical protein